MWDITAGIAGDQAGKLSWKIHILQKLVKMDRNVTYDWFIKLSFLEQRIVSYYVLVFTPHMQSFHMIFGIGGFGIAGDFHRVS